MVYDVSQDWDVGLPDWGQGGRLWAERDGDVFVLRARDCFGREFELGRVERNAAAAVFDFLSVYGLRRERAGFDAGRQFAEQGHVDSEWGEE